MNDRELLHAARTALNALTRASRALNEYPGASCCEAGWCSDPAPFAEDAYCEGGAVDGIHEALGVVLTRARKRVEKIELRMLHAAQKGSP
jgi:hypothetical protein